MTDKPEFLGGPETTNGIRKTTLQIVNINTINEELLGYEMQLIDLLDKINGEIQELGKNIDTGSIEICRCLSDWKSEIGAFIVAVSTRRIEFENRTYEIRKASYPTPTDIKVEAMKAHKALYEDTK